MNEAVRFVLRRDAAVGRTERFLALLFVAAMIVVGVLILPVQDRNVGALTVFLQAYGVILGGITGLTGLLLLWRASGTREGHLAFLGAAYLFTTPLVMANALTVPGVSPLFQKYDQAAAYIWIFWQVGFAIGILPFVAKRGGKVISPLLFAVAALLFSDLCIAAALFLPHLPPLVTKNGDFTPLIRYFESVSLVAYGCELSLLLRRSKKLTTLELWVAVALLTLVYDILINFRIEDRDDRRRYPVFLQQRHAIDAP